MALKKKKRSLPPTSALKSNVLATLIDSGVVAADEEVSYLSKKDGSILKQGKLSSAGISCLCCSRLYSLTGFELHAGSKAKRPAANIFLRNGQISLAVCEEKAALLKGNGDHSRVSENRSSSEIYDSGGSNFSEMELVNGQEVGPSNSRQNLSLTPRRVKFSRKNDSPEVIRGEEMDEGRGRYRKRLRDGSVNISEDDTNEDCCAICCEGGDMIGCDNCPLSYHFECANLKQLRPSKWFCPCCFCVICKSCISKSIPAMQCKQCHRKIHTPCVRSSTGHFCSPECGSIFKKLEKMVGKRDTVSVGKNLSWILFKHSGKGQENGPEDSKLPLAMNLMQTCFPFFSDLWKDSTNCSAFYTVILEQEEKVASVAILRVHGNYSAEMPFVATDPEFQKKGMCRRLVGSIENLLHNLGVERLVIPAIAEAEGIWITSFNFRPVNAIVKQELLARNVLVFPGTRILQKQLLNRSSPSLNHRPVSFRPGTPPLLGTAPSSPEESTKPNATAELNANAQLLQTTAIKVESYFGKSKQLACAV